MVQFVSYRQFGIFCFVSIYLNGVGAWSASRSAYEDGTAVGDLVAVERALGQSSTAPSSTWIFEIRRHIPEIITEDATSFAQMWNYSRYIRDFALQYCLLGFCGVTERGPTISARADVRPLSSPDAPGEHEEKKRPMQSDESRSPAARWPTRRVAIATTSQI